MTDQRLPKVLFHATRAALALLPLSLIWVVLSGGLSREALLGKVPQVPVSEGLSDVVIYLAALPGLVGLGVALFVLWQMQSLFRIIGRGEALSVAASLRVRRIGLGLLALAVAGPALRPIQILLLTSANPPGERMLAIGFSSTDMALFLASGLLVVIGASMADAAVLAEENRSFV